MTLIDLDQEVQYTYPDPDSGLWKNKTGTIKELLQIYTAYQFINVLDINSLKWGTLEDYGKKEKSNKFNIFA